jgi:hypothetical protein
MSITKTFARVTLATVLSSLPALARQEATTETLGKLVPTGTVAYVQVPSCERLVAVARQVSELFEPGSSASIDPEMLLGSMNLGEAWQHVDQKRPFGVAFGFAGPEEQEPVATLLVPVDSVADFVTALEEMPFPHATTTGTGYVAVTMAKSVSHPSRSDSIVARLPAGDLVMRIDLEQVIARFRPQIDAGLREIEHESAAATATPVAGFDARPMVGQYFEGARAVIDSADVLDIALRLQDQGLEIQSALATLPGSVLAGFASKEKTDASDLARYLDPDASWSLITGFDMAGMYARFHTLFAAAVGIYPEPMRPQIEAWQARMPELVALCKNAIAASGDLSPKGMRSACVMKTSDGKKLSELYRSMLVSMPGIKIEGPTEATLEGIAIERWRIKVDASTLFAAGQGASADPDAKPDPASAKAFEETMKAIYGEDGLSLAIGSKGDVATFVLGGDEAYLAKSLARLHGGGGGVPGEMRRRLDEYKALSPFYVGRYDYGAMMRWARTLVGSQGGASELVPDFDLVMTWWGGVDGPIWRNGVSFDLDKLARSFRELQAKAAAIERSKPANDDPDDDEDEKDDR